MQPTDKFGRYWLGFQSTVFQTTPERILSVPRACADALGASHHNGTDTRMMTCQLLRIGFTIVFFPLMMSTNCKCLYNLMKPLMSAAPPARAKAPSSRYLIEEQA